VDRPSPDCRCCVGVLYVSNKVYLFQSLPDRKRNEKTATPEHILDSNVFIFLHGIVAQTNILSWFIVFNTVVCYVNYYWHWLHRLVVFKKTLRLPINRQQSVHYQNRRSTSVRSIEQAAVKRRVSAVPSPTQRQRERRSPLQKRSFHRRRQVLQQVCPALEKPARMQNLDRERNRSSDRNRRLADGGGLCQVSIACDGLTLCPTGSCPQGSTCLIGSCCGDPVCVPLSVTCPLVGSWTTGCRRQNGR
jgi:hypothetical protein